MIWHAGICGPGSIRPGLAVAHVACFAQQQGERSIPELVRSIYAGTDPELWPAAGEQLSAYLIALEREGRVRARDLAGELVYSLT